MDRRHAVLANVEIGIPADRTKLCLQQPLVILRHINGIEVPETTFQIDSTISGQSIPCAVLSGITEGEVMRLRHRPDRTFQSDRATGDPVLSRSGCFHPHIPWLAKGEEGWDDDGGTSRNRDA